METLFILGALVAPLLYAVTNHLDKVLLRDYKDSSLTLWTVSLLASIVPALVIFVIDSSVIMMDRWQIGVMFLNGLLNTILLRLYLMAMDQDEPTATITFYQLVPIFGVLLGYYVLGEFFALVDFVGMAIIMVGTSFMIFATEKVSLRMRTVVLMAGASFCWAGESTIFKMVAIEESLWQALFWENFSMFCYGLLALLLPSVRASLAVVAKRPGKMIAFSAMNESLYILGNVAASVMLTIVPVAVNLLFNTFQTFFVLGIGIIVGYFVPTYEPELTRSKIWKYSVAILITSVGVYLIGEWE